MVGHDRSPRPSELREELTGPLLPPARQALNQVITRQDPDCDLFLYCDVSSTVCGLFRALTASLLTFRIRWRMKRWPPEVACCSSSRARAFRS